MATLNLSIYTILLVDDVRFVRETVTRVMGGMGRPTVIEADDGEKALEILGSKRIIDFVISDFNMPRFNGLQLLKAVRTGAASVHRGLPFAMLTGFSDKHLVDSALALDVNAFLLKPVSRKTLSERLTKMLNRGDEEPWLKSADDYRKIAIEEARAAVAPGQGQETAPAAERGLDPRQLGGTAAVMRRLSSLSGKFEDSDFADQIGNCVELLVGDNGDKAASRIVSYLDGLVLRDVVKIEDLPRLLADIGPQGAAPGQAEADRKTPPPAEDVVTRARKVADLKQGELFFALDDVPSGTVLTRNVHTEDGSLFVTWGTRLTPQIIGILRHLDKMRVLALSNPEPGLRGVYVSPGRDRGGATLAPKPQPRAPAAQPSPTAQPAPAALPEGTGERQVRPSEAPVGAVITRDILTADGRLYLHAGAQLSARMLSILNDLDQLGHMKSELWIES